MKNRYCVDFGFDCWYVYDKKTDKLIKEFKTREKARKYAKRRNKAVK